MIYIFQYMPTIRESKTNDNELCYEKSAGIYKTMTSI